MHLVAPWFLIARVEPIMSGKVDEENLVCTFFSGIITDITVANLGGVFSNFERFPLRKSVKLGRYP